jgi:hypothetical protein
LPAGGAAAFIADISGLIDNLVATFPAVFEHPTYQQRKSAIDRAFNQRYDRALDVIERLALEKDVALYRDSTNIAFTPMLDGKALDEAEFSQLPEADRERFHTDISELEERLNEELASLPQWKRESNNQLRHFNEETITLALQPLLAPLSEKYAENAGVCGYLQAMQVYLLKTVVEQLVDDARPTPRRASCSKSSTARAWWWAIRSTAARRWCSNRTRPTTTCLAVSNTALTRARSTPPIASCARARCTAPTAVS